MPCVLVVKAVSHGNYTKGCPVRIREYPLSRITSKGGLPNFIHIGITDRDKADLEHYLQQWHIKYQHEIIQNNDDNWRIVVSVDPVYINASQTSKNVMKTEMINFLQSVGAYSITFSSASVTFNLPKTVDRVSLRSQFSDIFDGIFDIRRYYLSNGAVNNVVSSGGTTEVTFSQMLPYVRDKLAE